MLNALCVGMTLILLLGVALLFHVALRVTPEEGLASSIMVALTLIYVFGLFGNTMPAVAIIGIMGLFGFFWGVAAQVQNQSCRAATFFSPGIVMLICLTGFALVAFHGFHICNWDELYQWGKAANYMVEKDRLPNGDAFSGQSLLLSNTTFFHYLITKLYYIISGRIVESDYYVSNLLLWFSAVLLPLSGCGWKEGKRVWGFGLFQFLLTALIFVQPYYNIYTDQATAYWTGGLIGWLVWKKYSKRSLYLVPLILVNVGMMKSMVGPLFAGIAVLAVLVLYGADYKEQGKRFLPENWKNVLFSKKGIFGLATVLTPVLFVGIWSFIVGKNGIFRGHFHWIEKKQFVLTVKSMVQKLFVNVNMKNEGMGLSYLLFFIVAVGLLYVLYPFVIRRPLLSGYTKLIRIYLLGFAGYFLIMLFAYLYIFGYTDSVRAMSLERYFSDYMMLGVVPLTLPLFFAFGQGEEKKHLAGIKKGLIVCSFLYIIAGSSSYILPNLFHIYAVDTDLYGERERFLKYTKKVKVLTGEEGKIYFINQASTGLYTLVADYEMGEQLSREGMCFNFRKDTRESVIGLTEYDIATLPDVLTEEGYQYLWIYTGNDYLKDKFKDLFGIENVKNGAFYRVMDKENGVALEYMGNVQK